VSYALPANADRSGPRTVPAAAQTESYPLESFDGFGLNDAIARALAEEKYTAPTPVQMQNRIKTLAGDRVTIEISPYDPEKGRLIFRHKDERAGSAVRPAQRNHYRPR
jgi:Translation initiation factor 1A / IF-1